jgi:hypothetical protein
VPTWWNGGLSILYGEWLYGGNREPMRIRRFDLTSRRVATLDGSEGLWTPRASPDGRYLGALRQDSALLLQDGRNGAWRPTVVMEELDDPVWSPDSGFIYLTARHRRQLIRVRVRDGKVEDVADLHDFPLLDEAWFGVAPDGSALALQDVRQQEIYSLDWIRPY